MRCGIPLLGDRVAARCTCANGILVVTLGRSRVLKSKRYKVEVSNGVELRSALHSLKIDLLVCGGIDRATREELQSSRIRIMENVACSSEQVLTALDSGCLCPGYGFSDISISAKTYSDSGQPLPAANGRGIDCLACRDRVCLRGENCLNGGFAPPAARSLEWIRILEAATDISSEQERRLCRLAELVYFCLEMEYRRIGIAFCVDLVKPAEILANVLSRTFETVQVCCKIGGHPEDFLSIPSEVQKGLSDVPPISCNPMAQAWVLNHNETDLNVAVGLCLGADCIFSRESEAPVTTLFVKDKSLANNPIGALYSEYYLRESVGNPLFPAHTNSEGDRTGAVLPGGLFGREDQS